MVRGGYSFSGVLVGFSGLVGLVIVGALVFMCNFYKIVYLSSVTDSKTVNMTFLTNYNAWVFRKCLQFISYFFRFYV